MSKRSLKFVKILLKRKLDAVRFPGFRSKAYFLVPGILRVYEVFVAGTELTGTALAAAAELTRAARLDPQSGPLSRNR